MKRDVKSNLAHAARLLGKKGGPARAKVLTKAQRSEIASKGGKARHGQKG